MSESRVEGDNDEIIYICESASTRSEPRTIYDHSK